MKIRDIEIKNPVIMAPMAGITNMAFRKIVKEFGAGLVYSEMVSDKAICYGNQKTIEMLQVWYKLPSLLMNILIVILLILIVDVQ